MVISSSHIYSKGNLDVVKTNPANKINVKKFSQIILIAIFLSSCSKSINKDYPLKNLEKNIKENPNPEKKRMEIKFSCGEDGI